MTVYYTYSENLVPLTKARPAAVGSNFTAVQTSFVLVDADMQLRAPTNSPTFTGTVTVPTPLTPAAAATKAYVDALAVASGNVPLGGTIGQVLKKNSSTNYDMSWGPSGITRSARTSNTILGATDSGSLIDITSGTFTQTLTAAATLGSVWYCYIRNSGTGDITLDPNASETIDGLTSFVMYPGEVRLVQCDGTGFNSFVLSAFAKTFTASGTFTKPPGYQRFAGLLWGGGAGGGKSTAAPYPSGGGGGGACHDFSRAQAEFGATETITIGAGGNGASSMGPGSSGGASTIGSVVASYGGGGGGGDSSGSYFGGGGGGISTAGTVGGNGATSPDGGMPGGSIYSSTNSKRSQYYGGGSGAGAQDIANAVAGGAGGGVSGSAGGNSVFGGGGGGSPSAAGGTSIYAGSGGAGSSASTGTAGTAPAGGGGGTCTGTAGGAGARGELRIWGVI